MAYNESDTRAKLIDPAIKARGWTEDHIRRETTQPQVRIVGGRGQRSRSGRTDYILRYRINPGTQPVALALIEAKAEDKPPTLGLEQAKRYRERFHVPFVFSSNGHLFVEYDHFTARTTTPQPLAAFPSPGDLRSRYEHGMGFSLADEKVKPLLVPYAGGDAERRYYQDAAIRAVLEKLAHGEKRALLTLATGTGKTFIAVNLLRRIADAGQLRRALFLCDRDELRKQGLNALAARFGSDAAEVKRVGNRNNAQNARIHVATYQTLGVADEDDDATFLTEFYPDNHFSHIVIDECHRSAWGKWHAVLARNPDAVQIGLTATPRTLKLTEDSEEARADERIRADNIHHFGEPVYSYDIAQGIEDGYLAACEIVKRDIFLEAKTSVEAETGLDADDIRNRPLSDAITGRAVGFEEAKQHYDAGAFESRIELPERVAGMCRDLFDNLIATGGPEQKTIIFCARDSHADRVTAELNNLYAVWRTGTGSSRAESYAFKCTAAAGGADYLPDLKGAERSHFIACTVDLLTTGVDVPWLRNVVFFRYMRSPIAFYQMVGRGTRIHEASGKLMFRVYDYTDATRLLGEEFRSQPASIRETGTPEPPDTGTDGNGGSTGTDRIIVVEGVTVEIREGGRYILMRRDGRDERVPIAEYRRMLAAELLKAAPNIGAFRSSWIEPPKRRAMIDPLVEAGFSPKVLQIVENMNEYDSFDVLGEATYGIDARTRLDRAERFKRNSGRWLDTMPVSARTAVLALADQFARGGTEELETASVLRVPAVARAGGVEALKALGHPREVLRQTRARLFAS